MSAPVRRFFEGSRVLVANVSASSQAVLAGHLVAQGVARDRIHFAFTVEEALFGLRELRHDFILCDDAIGLNAGFMLAREQRELYSRETSRQSFFVMVTKNASQYAVAHAAEEQVDAYLIKPF